MTQRRKNLSEKDIRTIIAVFESVMEDNQYNWHKMNRFIGSMTLDEMLALQDKLKKWYDPEKYNRDPEDEGDYYEDEYGYYDPAEYAESYSDYISSYIY